MSDSQNEQLLRCLEYLHSKSNDAKVEGQLGTGTDGSVWKTSLDSAIKLFEREYNYDDELECYLRIQEAGWNDIDGLSIPELCGHDKDLLIIEIGIVQPPYLLDFGKVYLDRPPPYADDENIMQQFYEETKQIFEHRYTDVLRILNRLETLGIYYVDPKPANINFGDHLFSTSTLRVEKKP